MRYAHTNLIARDWRSLATFYVQAMGCVPVPPPRDQHGDWLSAGTGVPDAALSGMHLRLPGHGDSGPTLEVFTYTHPLDRPTPAANRVGLAHLAFEVADVDAALKGVLAQGGSPLGDVVHREVPGVGALTFTYARDPEGNILELQRWARGGAKVAAPAVATPELGVAEAYATWAETYDQVPNKTRDADAIVLRRLMPRLDGKQVLEMGCGTGKNTAALHQAETVDALDFSRSMLQRARAKVPSATFHQHDLHEPLPFPAARFHWVFADLVLEHIRDLEPLFVEVARVLRPGGEATFIELHPYRQLRGGKARVGEATVQAWHHSVSAFCCAATAAGMQLIAVEEWGDEGEPCASGDMPRLVSLRVTRPA
jgi:glyoxylase I family protein